MEGLENTIELSQCLEYLSLSLKPPGFPGRVKNMAVDHSRLRPAAPPSCPPQTWVDLQELQAEHRLSPSSGESSPKSQNTTDTQKNKHTHKKSSQGQTLNLILTFFSLMLPHSSS